MRAAPLTLGIVLCAMSVPRVARAGEATNLAEPIVEENITDVDATGVGTLEGDLTGASMMPQDRSRRGDWTSEMEIEWRPIDRLGFGAGLAIGGATAGLSPGSVSGITPRVAVSYIFVRDLRRKIFLQAEGSARSPKDDALDPTDPTLPYGFGLRWASGIGPLTLRSGIFGEAGGTFARAPIRQHEVVLLRCLDLPTTVYVGAEVIEDWARTAPLLLVPEALVLFEVLGRELRLGIGVPMIPASDARNPEIGLAFRFVVEPED